MGWCWLARTSTPFIYAILAGMFFGVDTQDTHDALCARACGGKVGAGTVEAEEDICVGKVHRWVGSVGLSCCLRGQISRIDKQEMEQPYVCRVFTSWLEGCVYRFCRVDCYLAGRRSKEDDSR